jgi:Phage terminase, small subunit
MAGGYRRNAGRPPTPTVLKLIRGNPGKRAISKHEPQPRLEIPPCPRHLDREARKELRRISKQLYDLGLLTEIDGAALAIYCTCYSRWVAAQKQLEENGLTVPGRGGVERPSPAELTLRSLGHPIPGARGSIPARGFHPDHWPHATRHPIFQAGQSRSWGQ